MQDESDENIIRILALRTRTGLVENFPGCYREWRAPVHRAPGPAWSAQREFSAEAVDMA